VLRAGLRACAAVLVCGVALGCQSAPEPAPIESETPKSAPDTRKASPTVDEQKSAAVQAVKDWLDASYEARKDLDPAPLVALSGSKCETCDFRVQTIEDAKKAGQHYEGDFKETVVSAKPDGDMRPTRVLVTARAGSWKLVGDGGRVVRSVKALQDKAYYDMELREGRWIVAEVTGIS
jgi:hypothetical protein